MPDEVQGKVIGKSEKEGKMEGVEMYWNVEMKRVTKRGQVDDEDRLR